MDISAGTSLKSQIIYKQMREKHKKIERTLCRRVDGELSPGRETERERQRESEREVEAKAVFGFIGEMD